MCIAILLDDFYVAGTIRTGIRKLARRRCERSRHAGASNLSKTRRGIPEPRSWNTQMGRGSNSTTHRASKGRKTWLPR